MSLVSVMSFGAITIILLYQTVFVTLLLLLLKLVFDYYFSFLFMPTVARSPQQVHVVSGCRRCGPHLLGGGGHGVRDQAIL